MYLHMDKTSFPFIHPQIKKSALELLTGDKLMGTKNL